MARNKPTRKKQKKFLTYRWLRGVLRQAICEMIPAHEAGEKVSVSDFARLVHFHRERYGLYRPEVVVEWIEIAESGC